MNKRITMLSGLALAALALSSSLNAFNNKTYLATRSINHNLAADPIVFYELTRNKKADQFGGTLQVSAFYTKSTHRDAQSYFFGPSNKDRFTAYTNDKADFNISNMLHDNGSTRTNPSIISLEPVQTVHGLRFHYNHDFSNILEGLFVRATMPVVRMSNSLGLQVENKETPSDAQEILSYFAGNYSKAVTDANAQSALTHCRITGKELATGVADVTLVAGYKFLQHHHHKAALTVSATLPTGNKPTGIKAWEPITGSAGHFALGAGAEYSCRLAGHEKAHVNFVAALDYRYQFEAQEMRTIGLQKVAWGHYNLLLDTIAYPLTSTNNLATPAANVLTVSTNITPGHSIELLSGLNFKSGNFTYDTGYTLRYKDKGSAVINKAWNDTQYQRITTGTADLTADLTGSTSAFTLDPSSVLAETMSHTFFTNMGYVFSSMKKPLCVSVGGHYELANNNASLTSWGINAKASLSF